MGLANIKLPTEMLGRLKRYTGEKTGQRAVQKAILYFLKEARQRRIAKVLSSISFQKGFHPLKLRTHER